MSTNSIVYLNGKLVPKSEASIPVMDRGFLLGDGVYEVIPVFAGRPLRLAEHLHRLNNSLGSIRIKNPLSDTQWDELIHQVIEANHGGDQSVYLQVTRGIVDKRDHAFEQEITPTIFIMSNPLTSATAETLRPGSSAITVADIRWARCDIKAITLLANVLLRQEAVDAGAAEAILLKDGNAIEGAASNLFIVENGTIITPPIDSCLLPGITRDLILEIARNQGLSYREDSISEQQLRNADEIWMTSSTREILPIIELDKKPVGSGKTGPVWEQVYSLYSEYKQRLSQGLVT